MRCRPAADPSWRNRRRHARRSAPHRPTDAPLAVGRAERGALELGFGRQPRAAPARVGGRFGLADVDRPGRRQRNQLEHAAPVPARRPSRSQNSGCATPLALRPRPSPRRATTAGRDSRRPRRTPGNRAFVTLCRSIANAGTSAAQRRESRCPSRTESRRGATPSVARPRGIVDPFACAATRPVVARRVAGRRDASARTAGDATCTAASPGASPRARGSLNTASARSSNGCPGCSSSRVHQRIDHRRVGFVGERADLLPARPAGRRVRRAVDAPPAADAFVRVDAACEQRLEAWVDARLSERLLHQRVEAESGQMPFVEHQRMAQRDRLSVVGFVGEQIEERFRPLAITAVPLDQLRTVEPGGGQHLLVILKFRRFVAY